jgi:hypothetical protein
MSKRELIAKNIEQVLRDTRDPKPIFVTRETLDVENLARSQFPAVFITTDTEDRAETTLQGSSGTRFATITYNIVCYVTGTALDTLRNDIVERVEEALEADRSRGGNAIDTQTIAVNVNNDVEPPIGEVTVVVNVLYQYTRGIL